MKLTTGIAALALTISSAAIAQTSTSTSSASTTTTTQKEVKVKKSPWGVLLLNSFTLSGQDTNDGSFEKAEASGYLNVDYKFGKDQAKRVSIRPYYEFDPTVDGGLAAGDVMIRYNDSKMATIFGEDLNTQFRYYAPVSTDSEASGQQLFMMYNTLTTKLGNGFSLTFNELDYFFGYTKQESANLALYLIHSMDLGYKINDSMNFTTSLAYKNYFFNKGPNTDGEYNASNRNDKIDLDFVLSSTLSDNFILEVTAGQSRSLRRGTAAILLNESEMEYALNLYALM